MAKTVTPVVESSMKTAIFNVENDGPLATQAILYEKVAAEYKRLVPVQDREVTANVVIGWIKRNNFPIKTQPGKRGSGLKPCQPGETRNFTRTTRAEKFAKDPEIINHLESLKVKVPERYVSLTDKIAEGSLKAALKLKCLECCNYQREEIRECRCKGRCAVWHLRPFQHDEDEEADLTLSQPSEEEEVAIAV